MFKRRSLITKSFITTGLILGLLSVFACQASNDGPSTADDSDTLAQGYAHPERLVSVSWLKDHLEDDNLKIIDVRKHVDGVPEAYNEGHIPGAISIPANTTFQTTIGGVKGMLPEATHIADILSAHGIKPTDTVVFYDNIKSLWASRALWGMDVYGHEDSKILNGDIKLWVAYGYDLSQEKSSITKTSYEFTAEPKSDLVISIDTVQQSLGSETVVLDTRSSDEFSGKDARADRGGHIPGSVHVNWTNNSNEDGTFLSGDELKDLYVTATIESGVDVYTLCQTAVRATHSWFVLSQLLGYDNVGVYDGSWTEWGNRTDTPIDAR